MPSYSILLQEKEVTVCHSLRIQNITLDEGSSVIITRDVISLKQSKPFISNLNSGQMFTIWFTQLPHNGQLYIDSDIVSRNKSYFVRVIYENKLSYAHDGTDTNVDDFSFSLDFASGKQLEKVIE